MITKNSAMSTASINGHFFGTAMAWTMFLASDISKIADAIRLSQQYKDNGDSISAAELDKVIFVLDAGLADEKLFRSPIAHEA